MVSRYIKLLVMLLLMGISSLTYSKTLNEYINQHCKANCVDTDTVLSASRMVADSLNLDYLILLSIIRVESGFNRKARNGSSVGLMQVHLRYHRNKFGNSDALNPYSNIFVGASILKDCMDRWRNTNKAFRCYNGGGDPSYTVKVNKALVEVKQLEIQ